MRSYKHLLLFGAVGAFAGNSVRADLVTDWNTQLLTVIKGVTGEPSTNPPKASYNLAVMQTAIYDAVNGINRSYQPYLVNALAPAGASAEAAVNQAAYQVLNQLYPAASFPSINASFTSFYNAKMATIPAGAGKTDGQIWGAGVASQIFASRVGDGSTTPGVYSVPAAPGVWIPTPAAFASPLLPAWGDVKPFGVPSVAPFVPSAPPALDSAAYALSYNQVKDLGSATSLSRTADQTEIARFWADGGGTVTPPGHWNLIAQGVVNGAGLSLVQSARVFAALNISGADASIAAWETKYAYNLWRPITAIRLGDTDGNAATDKDAAWTPMLGTPPFPSYTSGHSTFSSAAAAVLSEYFGSSYAFSTPSQDPSLPVTRSFSSFQAAAEEAGLSRIYGGIHFDFDNTAGLWAGAGIGGHVVENYFAPVPEVTTVGPIAAGVMMVGGMVRRRRQTDVAL